MKILSIIEATTVTGPAKNLLNFCRLLRSPEFCLDGGPQIEVSIVTFDRVGGNGDSTANAFVAAARDAGITVDVIRERFRFDRAVIKQLRDIVERRAPDIIQTHMIKSHFLVKLVGLGRQYPWIAYHHGYTTTDLKMQFYNRLNRWSLPSAARVITVCDAFAKQLADAGVRPERLSVRHNSVVAPRKASGAEVIAIQTKFGIADDESVILSVGRFSQEKGHADLIKAVANLRQLAEPLKFKLVLVGDGPEREQLENLANSLALTDRVVFVGHVSDVAPYYVIADALALPSHSEGSPNVLLEAMAAGLPIVATSVGGVPEIATSEENALLVGPHEPEVFANALHRVLTEPELASWLRTNAIDRASQFSPESYALSLVRIYQELVTEPRAVASGSYTQSRVLDPVAIAPGSDRPRVSVIIPLFNKAPFISRALESVAAQTFTDFELIVVDDGSTDDGPAIVETFNDQRLSIVRQENAGPGAARNRGLRDAKGEFVAFLDADDEWLPNYLADSVRSLDEQPEAAAVTSGYFAFPGGLSTELLWQSRGLTDGLVRVTPETEPPFVIALLPYMTPCTTVARASVLLRWGGFYQINRCNHAEDAHLWLKVLLNESVIVNLKPLTRIHFEASGPTQTRRSIRPVEPFLLDPEEIRATCPQPLRELLSRILAIRAFKTASMLGYWGRWREARELVRRFQVAGGWKLPYYTSSLVCRTPIGAAIGRVNRMVTSF